MRGFADVILQQMNDRFGCDAGVVIVQPTSSERGKAAIRRLNVQNCRYRVTLNGATNCAETADSISISCVTRALSPSEDYAAFLSLAEDDNLRYVLSNTTEAGIAFDERDRAIAVLPGTFPGRLTALLYRRYLRKGRGFYILPCELIDHNGAKLKETILRYGEYWALDKGFADWLEEENRFYDTLVDRIVTADAAGDGALGIQTERFYLWAICGSEEINATLPLNRMTDGVRFTEDLNSYRTKKVRILNGLHTAIVPTCFVLGMETMRQTFQDKNMNRFMRGVVYHEIIPSMDIPEDELIRYSESVWARFQNPGLDIPLAGVCTNSIAKFCTRVLPSIAAYNRKYHRLPEYLTFSAAALLEYYRGVRAQGPFPIRDGEGTVKFFQMLFERLDKGEITVEAFVENAFQKSGLFERSILDIPGFSNAVAQRLSEIQAWGMSAALRRQICKMR